MKENYLVTINILSYNRKDELRNTLNKVFEQDYKNIEVIVVDNASKDGTSSMVETEFPNVILIKLNKNIGISGWNKGFETAKGEFILVLDDDSYPDKKSVFEGIRYFNNYNNLGIVAFNIFNNRIKKSETIDYKPNPRSFVGCGALIRKEVLLKIGFYNPLYFIYYHELDFSARCYNADYDIKYISNTFIFHNQNSSSRGKGNEDPYLSEYRFKNHFISYSIFLIQNFDFNFSIKYFLKWFINRALICLRYSFFEGFFQAIFHLIKVFPKIIKNRKPLGVNIQKFYEFGNVPFIDKSYFPNI